MNDLRVSIAQINTTVGALHSNAENIITHIELAHKEESDIVVFPELSLCGYPPEDLLQKPYFVKDCWLKLTYIVKNCKGITALVGFPYYSNKCVYNSVAVICNKKIAAIYKKHILPNYGVFDEKRYFNSGDTFELFDQSNIRWGVTICEDIWVLQGQVSDLIAYANPDMLINISASPYHCNKLAEREILLKKQARKNNMLILYANLVGAQDELVFDGGSLIVSPQGKIVGRLKQFEEDMLTVDVNSFLPKKQKKRITTSKSITIVALPQPSAKQTSFTNTLIQKPLSAYEEIYNALVLGLHDYVFKNRFKKVVLGLSGGIDSTLVALLAADAVGKENVLGVCMPSPFTSKKTVQDQKRLINRLRIDSKVVSITRIFNSYVKEMKPYFKDKQWDVTEENIQARIRGNILMAFSNKFGYLVLTTGNKSETSVGYCTLYGDMAGGFAVIKDVPKGLVYALTHYRNNKEKVSLVPQSIFNKAPSAELRNNQKDQDALPSYNVLDKIIELYIEENKSVHDIASGKISKQLAEHIIYMIEKNEYKRRQAPPGIKITPQAFGRDRRMPITNQYHYL